MAIGLDLLPHKTKLVQDIAQRMQDEALAFVASRFHTVGSMNMSYMDCRHHITHDVESLGTSRVLAVVRLMASR